MIAPQPYPFLSAKPVTPDCRRRIIGLPFDAACSFRRGAAFGPQQIRWASESIESWSPIQERDLEDIAFCDCGDLPLQGLAVDDAIAQIRQYYREAYQSGYTLIGIGGDHAVTIGALQGIKEAGKDFAVLHLDAHLDLRLEYDGTIYSHASIARRAAELLGSRRLVQWGCRSGERPEWEYARENDTFTGRDLLAFRNACNRLQGIPVYITLDLDVFDPAEMPGVGTPEPGGLSYREFQVLVKAFQDLEVIGFDVVEAAPNLDPSGRSSVFTAHVVRELLLAVIS